MSEDGFDGPLSAAREAIAAGEMQEALAALCPLFEYPGRVSDTDRLTEALAVFSPVAAALGDADLAALVERHGTAPNDSDVAYDLAYALYEHRLFGFAATLLARANAIDPNHPKILAELATALEARRENAEARDHLAAAPEALEGDPFLRYLLAFHQLMCGAVHEARAELQRCRFEAEGPREAAELLETMVVRAERLEAAGLLGHRALRAWHLALNGCLLLHVSPHGLEEGMNGRYANVADCPARRYGRE
jgi:Flp pilus assembly protein TadD